MGQYAELYISNYLLTKRESINPLLLSMFQSHEIETFERNSEDRIQPSRGRSSYPEQAFIIKATAAQLKDRLEIMGFTIDRVKKRINTAIDGRINELKERIHDENPSKEVEEVIQSEIKLLQNLTFEDYLNACSKLVNGVESGADPAASYLKGDIGRIPHDYEDRLLLRAVLECVPGDTLITYDITDLIDTGYFDPDDPEEIFDEILAETKSEDILREKILILTEGSSDIKQLRGAMSVLYPHLQEYYSFMDFELSNAQGSASSLVATIKAFVGSGIKNRIIALFDNDTAAEVAIKGLGKTELPANIKVIRYPNIKFAENYPTIGPNGISKMNINGLATSIELYSGQDVLRKDNKEFIPVHWRGFDQSVKKYQGEIIEKETVQARFMEKVKRCSEDRSKIIPSDWLEMDQLLRSVFNAFNGDNDPYFESFLDPED